MEELVNLTSGIWLVTLVVGLVVTYVLYAMFKKIFHIIVHGILGFAVLVVANSFMGLGITFSLPIILVSFVGGLTGSVILIILYHFGIHI